MVFRKGHIPHNKGKFISDTYGSVHNWLLRNFKKGDCVFCGSDRFVEFALKKGKGHEHKRENYLDLCASCHKKYDYTAEIGRKRSKSLKGRKITWADKISKANMGRVMTVETKKKMSDAAIINHKKRKRNEKGHFV